MPPENLQPQDHPTEPLLEAGLIQSKQIGDETNSLLEAIIQQNSENNPEPILEAMLVQDKQNTDAIVEALKPTAEATSKLAQFLTDMKGEKGDRGDDGIDGKDADEPAIIQSVLSQIPVPENGIDGRDGLDGQDGTDGREGRDGIDGKDGKDGIDGKSPKIDYKKIVAETVKRVPEIDIDAKVKEITDAVSQNTNDTLQSIRTKVASRTYSMGELSDTQSATVGQTMVKQADNTWAPGTASGGSKHVIKDETISLPARANLNFTGAGVNATDNAETDSTDITIAGGGGMIVETPAGTINGSNVTFTVTVAPKFIVTDTGFYIEGFGYSRATLTITMDLGPNLFIRAYS